VIVVDTSIWIRALRSTAAAEAITLRSLLEADEVALAAPVRSELLMAARLTDRTRLERELKGVPLLYPSDDSWRTLDRWTLIASRSGATFSVSDLLIGVLTTEIGGLVWSADSDFSRMAALKLIQRFSV
jgi:predicted nucleic acid-binding protein